MSRGVLRLGSEELIVRDFATGVQIGLRRDRPDPVRMLALHADGARVWIPTLREPYDTHTYWNADHDTFQNAPIATLHSASSRGISPDRQILAYPTEEHDLILLDVHPGIVLHGLEGPVRQVAFSPDSSRLLVIYAAAEDARFRNTVPVLSATTGRELGELRGHSGEVFDAVFSPDGSKRASRPKDYAWPRPT